jgi:hypothetical protein
MEIKNWMVTFDVKIKGMGWFGGMDYLSKIFDSKKEAITKCNNFYKNYTKYVKMWNRSNKKDNIKEIEFNVYKFDTSGYGGIIGERPVYIKNKKIEEKIKK